MIVKNEKGDMVTDCHSILAMWRNHFPQLLYVYWVNVRHTEIHKVEPQAHEPSAFEVEMAILRS
jgi:sugar lactone lactonase YvrE